MSENEICQFRGGEVHKNEASVLRRIEEAVEEYYQLQFEKTNLNDFYQKYKQKNKVPSRLYGAPQLYNRGLFYAASDYHITGILILNTGVMLDNEILNNLSALKYLSRFFVEGFNCYKISEDVINTINLEPIFRIIYNYIDEAIQQERENSYRPYAIIVEKFSDGIYLSILNEIEVLQQYCKGDDEINDWYAPVVHFVKSEKPYLHSMYWYDTKLTQIPYHTTLGYTETLGDGLEKLQVVKGELIEWSQNLPDNETLNEYIEAKLNLKKSS